MERVTGYLIKTTEPFRGYTQSIIYRDEEGTERVAYTGRPGMIQGGVVLQEREPDLTVVDYMTERGVFKRITGEELDALQAAHIASLITEPEPISEERYNELLECLPPCRYHKAGRFTVFHISERLTANLVQWCAWGGSMECYGWTDHADLPTPEIIEKLNNATRRSA